MLTLIIGRSYQQGIAWLRDNKRRPGIDPQRCRIITNPDALLGIRNFRVIYLPLHKEAHGWKEMYHRLCAARSAGDIVEEVMG